MKKKRYPSDLTDGEWQHINGLIPKAKPGGRPRTLNMREVLNAIFYLIRGGIPWQMLPSDFPVMEKRLSLLPTLASAR